MTAISSKDMDQGIRHVLQRVQDHVTSHSTTPGLPPDLTSELVKAFDPVRLNEAFRDTQGQMESDRPAGIDYKKVKEAFEPMEENEDIQHEVAKVLGDLYKEHNTMLDPDSIILQRNLLVLLLCPALSRPDQSWSREIIINLAETFNKVRKTTDLRNWLQSDVRLLRQAVNVFHECLQTLRKSEENSEIKTIDTILETLQFLNNVNEDAGYLVPRNMFYIDDIQEQSGRSDQSLQVDRWLNMPFVLDVRTKWAFFSSQAYFRKLDYMEFVKQQNLRRGRHNRFALANPWCFLPLIPKMSPCPLFTNIDRDNIIASAIENVNRWWKQEAKVWQNPLQVIFGGGEYAVDLGGPSKEFFHLLFAALMDEKLSIFKKIDEKSSSSPVWFDPAYTDLEMLEKIGLLFALMIYNDAIVTVPFPLRLYELLLSNREQCVEDKVTQQEAGAQFTAFSTGFNLLAPQSDLLRKMFKPDELRDIILGAEFDLKELEKSALYETPYSADHPVVKMFWKVLHEMDESDQRRYLRFQTGTDHVPITGFKSLGFIIRRLDTRKVYDACPGEICPEVMTCKGYLSIYLPEYESEDDVRFRLMKAVDMGMGFYMERPQSTITTVEVRRSVQIIF